MNDSADRAIPDNFFQPRGIAVIGASDDAGKIGAKVLRSLVRHGYRGKLYPINPNRPVVAGMPAFRSLQSVPGPIDLALIAIPAAHVPDALRECVACGVPAAVIHSSGFREEGTAGAALEQEIIDICRTSGIRVSGPNGEGFFSVGARVAATFSPAISNDEGWAADRDQLAVIAQSGGLGFAIYNHGLRRNICFSHVVSVGNQADLEIADFVEHFITAPSVKAIAVYVESFKNPRRFIEAAASAARAGKPLIVAKVGNSDAGRRAAESHTGAIAGPATVVNAMFDHYGIIPAGHPEQLLDFASAFLQQPLPRGNRVAILSTSGGAAVWLADVCEASGLKVPEIDSARQQRLAEHIPYFGSTHNPIDITAQGVNCFDASLDILADSPDIDAFIIAGSFAFSERLEREAGALAAAMRRAGKPVLLYSYTMPSARSLELMREHRLHCHTSMADCAQALAVLVRYAAFQQKFQRRASDQSPPLDAAALATLRGGRGVLCEYKSKDLLRACGVGLAAESLATSAAEAVAAAERIGYPVVLKLQSPDIPHKSDAGGVKLNLATAEAVGAAFAAIVANGRRHCADADVHGVLVQRMARPGREIIVGTLFDRDYGPMIMVGLGGVYVEVLKDVAMRPAPIGREDALDMIRGLAGYPLLAGVRGEPPADVDALADVMVKISNLAAEAGDALAELDVNPVLVHAAGEGVTVVDALVVCGSGEHSQSRE